MSQLSKQFSLTACALAASVFLAACGGGDVSPPDSTPPTVVITDSVAGDTATGAVTYTFTFSEDVGSSFVTEDITVNGGERGAFTKDSATVYKLVVTPAAGTTGIIEVSVAASKYSDVFMNANTATASGSQAFDTVVVGAPSGTVVADFDTAVPVVRGPDAGGTGFITTTGIPAGGGTGAVLGLLRSGGEVYALNVLETVVQFAADRKTLSAKVYSPTAGIRMVMKVEGPGGAVEVDANETVVVGWQTLTWNFSAAKADVGAYNLLVILPNLGTVDAAPGKTYYFDDITVLPAAVAPPAGTATVVANFDTVVPVVRGPDAGGTGFITTTGIPAGGGTGAVLGLLRSGGEVYALNVLETVVQFAADRKTLSAKVYSPTAGIRMVMKVEGPGGAVEVDANETVVVGWQTLTWNFSAAKADVGAYNLLVILPNLGTVDAAPGKTYYFDDITVLPAAVAPPAGTDTVVADFDTAVPVVRGPDAGGTGFITTTGIPAGGGTGAVLGLLRSGGEVYALNVLETVVQFAADRKTLSAKVYSPTAGIRMVMKVEGPGGAVEVDANETVVVGWQTLTWNFSAAKADVGAYNLLVILPNLGTVDAAPGKTYYFDDIKLLAAAGSGGSGSSGASSLPVTFNDSAVTYALRGFEGADDSTLVADPYGANNTVVKVVKAGGAPWYAGTVVSTGANESIATIPFTDSAKTMKLRVYSPGPGMIVRLKVEKAGDPTISCETDATSVGTGWETLTFNFANPGLAPPITGPGGTAALNVTQTYNKAVVFMNVAPSQVGVAGTFYFDDLAFGAP